MIRVCLMRRDGRPCWEMQWRDAVTGRKVTRSTKTALRREAERVAARTEADLNSADGLHEASRLTWDKFVATYQAEVLDGQSKGGRDKMLSVLRQFKRLIDPAGISNVTAAQVGDFARRMRAEKIEETTIYSNLNCLRTALNWAARQRIIKGKINVEMPRRPPGMKGRPITAEEFDRMLAKAQDGDAETPWSHLLRGLWWSGLRLGEALSLHWTEDSRICVDLGGRRPMLFVRGQAEKGRKNRRLPIAPEFAEMLQAVPEASRTGYVFLRDAEPRPTMGWASRVISAFGEAAGIKVSPKKFASAHDLRRAFGYRWAMRVMPAILQELMRHETIATTMEFYVGRNAEATADAAWQAAANDLANKGHSGSATSVKKQRKT